MIQGTLRKNNLTKEAILQLVTEYDILRAFWPAGMKLELNRPIHSPFRKDDNPSFIVGTKYGYLTYKDMGDYRYRGRVWDFVQQLEGLDNLHRVLSAVDSRLGLGLGEADETVPPAIPITWEQPKIVHRPPPLIQVLPRKFAKSELAYWNDYHQGADDLKQAHIFVPQAIYINKRKLPSRVGELVFCYWYPEIEKWKLYRPHADKRATAASERKWTTNVPFDYVEGLSRLRHCDTALLTKSRKDALVLRKALGIDSIGITSAEDPACLTEDTIAFIKQESRRQVTVSDNDEKGKSFSWYLTNEHGFLHCNLPDSYRENHGWTDFADLAKGEGLDKVTQHFRQKGILDALSIAI